MRESLFSVRFFLEQYGSEVGIHCFSRHFPHENDSCVLATGAFGSKQKMFGLLDQSIHSQSSNGKDPMKACYFSLIAQR